MSDTYKNRSRDRIKANLKDKFTLWILVVLNFFLTGVTYTSLVNLLGEERRYLSYHKLPQFCMSCSDLALHPDDDNDGVVMSENGTVCCASEIGEIPRLVEKRSGQWFKEKLYEDNTDYRGCKEVKRDNDRERNNPEKEFFKILGFENQRLNATHHRRMHWDEGSIISTEHLTYKHGYVTIGVRGTYQVYSQVIASYNFRPHYIYGTPSKFMHCISIKKSNNDQDEYIMASTMSECETNPNNKFSVSHIGTVYQFREGDRVAINVSYPEDVRPNPRMNFFGIHMI